MTVFIRFEIPEKMGPGLGLTSSLFGETRAMFIVVTIIFDFLLIYSKATLVGMQRRMLIHYKIILSGKETVKDSVTEDQNR